MAKRVVIVGGSGFLGRHLQGALAAKGYEVLSLSSKECNLLDADASKMLASKVRPEDVVVFASALTPDKGKDEHAFMKNVQMAYNAAAFFGATTIAQCIYISSDAVYGDEVNPITEATPAAPPSLYGIAHRSRELVLESACQRSKTPYLILRPCALYGTDDTHNSYGPNRFIKTAKSDGKISLFGQGLEKRDHLYVLDFCALIALAIEQGTTGIVNAGSGTAASFMDVATVIKGIRKDIAIETTTQTGTVTHRHFDVIKLRKTFPTFVPTALADGIKTVLN